VVLVTRPYGAKLFHCPESQNEAARGPEIVLVGVIESRQHVIGLEQSDRNPLGNLDVNAATGRQREGGVIEIQTDRIVVQVDSRRSEQNMSERLNPVELSQSELRAE
jgi:hypothetical protein